MQKIYQRPQLLHASYCNTQLRLDAYGAMRLFQDIAGEHALDLGVDFNSMLNKSNAFWVVTKIKIRFVQTPHLFEQGLMRTWPLAAKHGVCERCYTLETAEGGCVYARSEWVLLDADTHKLRRPESTCYPMHFNYCTELVLEEPYLRMRPNIADKKPYMCRKILSTDMDMSQHTNNTQYARFILDCFSSDFFNRREPLELEIHFLKESREGEELSIYKNELSTEDYEFAGLNGEGQTVFTAHMKMRAQ